MTDAERGRLGSSGLCVVAVAWAGGFAVQLFVLALEVEVEASCSSPHLAPGLQPACSSVGPETLEGELLVGELLVAGALEKHIVVPCNHHHPMETRHPGVGTRRLTNDGVEMLPESETEIVLARTL